MPAWLGRSPYLRGKCVDLGRAILRGLRLGGALTLVIVLGPGRLDAQEYVRPPTPGLRLQTESLDFPAGRLHSAPTQPAGSISPDTLLASEAELSITDARQRPDDASELYDRVLDLEPDRQNRQLIERVRDAVRQTQIGEDTTDEEWITVKGNSIRWGGRIHVDWINWANDDQFGGQSNYVEFRRLRLAAAGEGYGVYDYQLDLAFAPELDAETDDEDVSAFELKDAFVGIRDLPWIGYIRLGNYRTPFNLSSLTSSNDITFLERSLPYRLAPGRALGVAAYNRTPNENVTWSGGVFFDDLPQDSPLIENDNQGTLLIGRATWTPWYDVPSQGRYLLHTGLAYAYTRPRLQDDTDMPGTSLRRVRFRARPEIHQGDPLVDTEVLNVNQMQSLDAEMALVSGPLSLQSELVWTGIDEASGQHRSLYGAYTYVSWFLTGEHRQYNRRWAAFDRVVPIENFWMVRTPRGIRRGWGAWEVAVRWSYLDFSDFAGQQLHDLTVGMNWYWNPYTRVMFNWIHPWANNSPAGVVPRAEGDVIAIRMQVAF